MIATNVIALALFFLEIYFSHCTEVNVSCAIHVDTNATRDTAGPPLTVDCSKRGLTKVPDDILTAEAVTLHLYNNNITILPACVFCKLSNARYLDLSNNQIFELDLRSFEGLDRLQVLDLSRNGLCLHSSYPKGVFKDQKSLMILKTFSITDGVFGDLVGLEKLPLDATDKFKFIEEFRNLTQLTHQEASCYLSTQRIYVWNDAFENLHLFP